jgi:hypothetical protein
MYRNLIFSLVALGATTVTAAAQPPWFSRPQPPSPWFPRPQPQPPSSWFPKSQVPTPAQSPVDGVWFFRGNPFQPCYIQSVYTPFGVRLIFTNEMGSRATGGLSANGRQVYVNEWGLTGRVRRDRIVWPNGDFWSR